MRADEDGISRVHLIDLFIECEKIVEDSEEKDPTGNEVQYPRKPLPHVKPVDT